MDPDRITPEEFERTVKLWFESAAGTLDEFSANHREKIKGADGEYEIDVAVRFKILEGAAILVLAECKKQKSAVKRDVIQVLHDRMQSLGAHKGFVFTTSSFQKGALKYAEKHGIALVRVVNGMMAYIRASASPQTIPLLTSMPPYAAFLASLTEDGNESFKVFTEKTPFQLQVTLGIE